MQWGAKQARRAPCLGGWVSVFFFSSPYMRSGLRLLAEAELAQDGAVSLDVRAIEVGEVAAAMAYQLEKSALSLVIVLVRPSVC